MCIRGGGAMSDKFINSIRVTVFVPMSAAEEYVAKIQDHIPSFLGHYDRVLWINDPVVERGIEQFRPLPDANAAQGGSGETVREPSVKIEFSLPDHDMLCETLIEEILVPSHPWNEPVILLSGTKIYMTH